MSAAADGILPARRRLLRGLADALWRQPRLLLLLLLAPPLLWLGVIYLGSLFALLVQSFFSIDEFSGLIKYEFTLKTYGELFQPGQFRHHRAHRVDGGGGDAGRGDRRLSDRLLRGALCARQVEGAVLSRRHAAAVVQLPGQGLCLEADPGQGRHPELAVRQAAPDLAAGAPIWRCR